MRALVTDADDRKALAAIRFLGRDGVTVGAAGTRRWDQGLFSRFTRSTAVYPNPVRDAEAFVDFLMDYLRRERFDCVLPMSDYSTIPLSRHKPRFEEVTALAVPDYDVLEAARDKPRMTALALSLGIGAPETRCPSNLDEVRELAGRVTWPQVVKYKRGTGAVGVRYARTPEELFACYDRREHPIDIVFTDAFPMMQEYIPGYTCDACVLFNRGEPRAWMTTRRVKTWPPTGGRGVVVETTRDEDILESAFRLLRAVRWHGPAQVEFRRDSRDGRLKLMEINTRFWGGVGVAAEAGINFPHLAARMATEGDIKPVSDYLVGMRYRWPFPLELSSVVNGPSPVKGMLEYLRFRRGDRYDLWPSDPVPHVVGSAYAAYASARGIGRKRRR